MTMDKVENKPLVSVLIAAYNAERTIAETLESVLTQDYPNFVVLVVDDASTDSTPDILHGFQKKYGNLQVMRNERNLKFSGTRNRLLKEMPGDTEFVAVIDSDDVAEPYRLSMQVAFLQEHPGLAAVGSDVLIIDEQSRLVARRSYPHSANQVAAEALNSNPVTHSALMLRRSAVDAVGEYDVSLSCCEDYDYILRILECGDIANLEEPLVRYRISPAQHTQKRLKEMLWMTLKIQFRHGLRRKFVSFENAVLFLVKFLLFLLPSSFVLKLFRNNAYATVQREEKSEKGWMTWIGIAYILLMALHIPLVGPFFVEDILAPLIALCILMSGNFRTYLRNGWQWLVGYFILAAISVLCHGKLFSFDFLVFLYMAGVFAFFRKVPFSQRQLTICGGGILCAVLVGWLPELLRAAGMTGIPETGLCYFTENATGTAMDFLHRRYEFLFENPNNLGSFMALPAVMFCSGVLASRRSWRLYASALLLLCLCLLPLCHTFSKHTLLYAAICGGFVSCIPMARLYRKIMAFLCAVATAVCGLVCETTVLWTAFPLKGSFPWINTIPGAYTIHQLTYLKMWSMNALSVLTGYSASALHSLYPMVVDKVRAEFILTQYNAMHVLEGYCTFMDPHNEYLNQLAFFGLPALCCLIVFWIVSSAKCTRRNWLIPVFFVAGLAFCCLWDDLLSKRWIWTAAGILLNSINASRSGEQIRE